MCASAWLLSGASAEHCGRDVHADADLAALVRHLRLVHERVEECNLFAGHLLPRLRAAERHRCSHASAFKQERHGERAIRRIAFGGEAEVHDVTGGLADETFDSYITYAEDQRYLPYGGDSNQVSRRWLP